VGLHLLTQRRHSKHLLILGPKCRMQFSAELSKTLRHWCTVCTNAKMWDTSAPNTQCRNVLGPKCLRSKVSVHPICRPLYEVKFTKRRSQSSSWLQIYRSLLMHYCYNILSRVVGLFLLSWSCLWSDAVIRPTTKTIHLHGAHCLVERSRWCVPGVYGLLQHTVLCESWFAASRSAQ